MAAQNYMHDIRSIRDVHQNLPAVLGNLDLDLRIQAHTPINRVLLTQAQGVAKALKGIKEIGNEPLVTDAVVQSADLEMRAHTIEAAHGSAEFSPVNLVHILQHMSNRLDVISAITHNTRIVSRNAQRRAPHPYLPLQKSIAGDGLVLAQAVAPNVATRNALVAPVQIPLLGDIPPNFNPNLPSYTHDDILQLIIFYNDDFGIVQADRIPSRIDSFRRFLSEI